MQHRCAHHRGFVPAGSAITRRMVALVVTGFLVGFGVLWSDGLGVRAEAAEQLRDRVLADPKSHELGETAYYQNCVYCHGSKGGGGKSKPLQCRDFTPDAVFRSISDGRRRGSLIMPPWKETLEEETRWQLVAYIISLKGLPGCGN